MSFSIQLLRMSISPRRIIQVNLILFTCMHKGHPVRDNLIIHPRHCACLPAHQISSSQQPVVRTYHLCPCSTMPSPSSHLRARACIACRCRRSWSRSFRRRPPSMFRYIAFLGLHCSGGIRVESHMMGLISPPTDITFIEHMGGHYELGWKGERSTKHFMVLDFQQECFLCLYDEGNSINNLVISSF